MDTQEEMINTAKQIASSWDWVTEVTQPEANRVDIYVKDIQQLIPIVVALRVKRLGYLSAITGLDHGQEAGEMEVLYHFCTRSVVITLRVRLPRENGAVPSLCDLIPTAEAFERELKEMFGIDVIGLHNPDLLYLPEEWPKGLFPLRKDVHPDLHLRGFKDDTRS